MIRLRLSEYALKGLCFIPIPSKGEGGEGFVSEVICICVHTHARIKIRYEKSLPSNSDQNLQSSTVLQISELAKSLQKVWKKWMQTFGRYVVKQ